MPTSFRPDHLRPNRRGVGSPVSVMIDPKENVSRKLDYARHSPKGRWSHNRHLFLSHCCASYSVVLLGYALGIGLTGISPHEVPRLLVLLLLAPIGVPWILLAAPLSAAINGNGLDGEALVLLSLAVVYAAVLVGCLRLLRSRQKSPAPVLEIDVCPRCKCRQQPNSTECPICHTPLPQDSVDAPIDVHRG